MHRVNIHPYLNTACWTDKNLTQHYGIRLLEASKQRFGDELVVFLDRASLLLRARTLAARQQRTSDRNCQR